MIWDHSPEYFVLSLCLVETGGFYFVLFRTLISDYSWLCFPLGGGNFEILWFLVLYVLLSVSCSHFPMPSHCSWQGHCGLAIFFFPVSLVVLISFSFSLTACRFHSSNLLLCCIGVALCGPGILRQLSLEWGQTVLGLCGLLCAGCCPEEVLPCLVLLSYPACNKQTLLAFLVWRMVLLVLLGKHYLAPWLDLSVAQCYFLWICIARARPHLLSGGLLFCTCGWLFHVSGWLFCCQCLVYEKNFYFPFLAMSLAVWVLGNDGFPLWVQKESPLLLFAEGIMENWCHGLLKFLEDFTSGYACFLFYRAY